MDLQEEVKKIEKMCSMLRNVISTMEIHLNVNTEKIEIVNCEEEYLIATKIPEAVLTDEKQCYKVLEITYNIVYYMIIIFM